MDKANIEVTSDLNKIKSSDKDHFTRTGFV